MLSDEAAIERAACKKALDGLGVRSIKLTSQYSRGWPDRVFLLHNAKVLFIEFKRPGGKLTPLQALVHESMAKVGHFVQVHNSINGAYTAIAEALEASTTA